MENDKFLFSCDGSQFMCCVHFIDDEQYDVLRKGLIHHGKGRPPNIPDIAFNNKLMVQLHYLKEETNRKCSDVITNSIYKV